MDYTIFEHCTLIALATLLLWYQGEAAKNQRPHVRLEEPGMLRYNEKSNDALGIKGYEKYQCHLYTLGMYSLVSVIRVGIGIV